SVRSLALGHIQDLDTKPELPRTTPARPPAACSRREQLSRQRWLQSCRQLHQRDFRSQKVARKRATVAPRESVRQCPEVRPAEMPGLTLRDERDSSVQPPYQRRKLQHQDLRSEAKRSVEMTTCQCPRVIRNRYQIRLHSPLGASVGRSDC